MVELAGLLGPVGPVGPAGPVRPVGPVGPPRPQDLGRFVLQQWKYRVHLNYP